MSELTFQELAAFLATPEAQALPTQAEKLAAAKAWKAALDQLNAEPEIEFDAAAHLATLKAERAEWGQAWRTWATEEQKTIRQARMDKLDAEIKHYESLGA